MDTLAPPAPVTVAEPRLSQLIREHANGDHALDETGTQDDCPHCL